jgi:crotonobetainyl-CoA:carnitine CoA-transferase CaiB-like acyl-CoA transferase
VSPVRGAPKLGQHSVAVLRDAGLSAHEIQALVESGTVIDGELSQGKA